MHYHYGTIYKVDYLLKGLWRNGFRSGEGSVQIKKDNYLIFIAKVYFIFKHIFNDELKNDT